ncbi:DUF3658 domain-containing protein [Desulfitobacterium hafniense]|uniref:DUF3658 domain-containing protein n=1 Tax=Desulfitobacterium hafniense TaxID=49338 RepID=UPI00036ABCC8|nr:DUF3658 domain-containing protein [Desulfitobacterium hafniense]
MIELAFNQSSAAGLKIAKSIKQGDRINGAFLFIGGTRQEHREAGKARAWAGITMEGSPKDVEELTLVLDIGDISDLDAGMNVRQKLLEELFEGFPGVPDGIGETNKHALVRLQEVKVTQEPVRIWICAGNPEELCGLYYVCHLLVDALAPLSVVRVPEQIENDDGMFSYRSTGEIVPEAFGAYTVYEEPISELRRRFYANNWLALAHENAPLRAVINGTLMGVPQDFYDFALRANMPEGEFKVARLIGKALGQIPGVGDRWLFLRVQAMLESGELIRVSAATEDHPYSEVVKRNSAYAYSRG